MDFKKLAIILIIVGAILIAFLTVVGAEVKNIARLKTAKNVLSLPAYADTIWSNPIEYKTAVLLNAATEEESVELSSGQKVTTEINYAKSQDIFNYYLDYFSSLGFSRISFEELESKLKVANFRKEKLSGGCGE